MTKPAPMISQQWWKRLLIGGFTSLSILIILSLIAEVVINSNPSDLILFSSIDLAIIFATPADLLLALGVDEIDPLGIYLLTIILFWFVAGAIIYLLDKNIKRAIGWWVLLVIIFRLIRTFFIGFG